jgi:hypothetical protein
VPDLDGLPGSEKELELLRQLTNAGVPFMLVGLGAVVVQGADAVMKDLDLWFRPTPHPGVAEAARPVGPVFAWRNNPPLFSRTGVGRHRHQVRRPARFRRSGRRRGRPGDLRSGCSDDVRELHV